MSSNDPININATLLLRGLAFEDFVGTKYLLVHRADIASFSGKQSPGPWRRVKPTSAIRFALQDAFRARSIGVETFLDAGHRSRSESARAVLDELQSSAVICRYVIFSKARPIMSALPHVANVEENDGANEDDEVEADEATDFVGIELVNAEGVAMPDTKVKVEYPDGTLNDHTTDANGLVYIRGIDPGMCKVEFVNADIN